MKYLILSTLFFVLLSHETNAQSAKFSVEETVAPSEFALKLEVKLVELSNGIKLEYVEQGDPSGLPVIFLHGISDSWRSFELNLPLLPHSIHAFAISQRGHGNSDKTQLGYRPKDFADDIAAFMDKMNLKKAIIVGHSMGSTNARQFVLSYPKRTMGLVIIGSFASYNNNAAVTEFEGVLTSMQDPIDVNFIHEFQKSTIYRPIPNAYYETVVKESQKLPVHVWQGVALGWKKGDLAERLSHLRTPTLIIWGDKDSFAPSAPPFFLNSVLRNSKLSIYRETGHAVHWEEPQRFVDELVEFINNLK